MMVETTEVCIRCVLWVRHLPSALNRLTSEFPTLLDGCAIKAILRALGGNVCYATYCRDIYSGLYAVA